MSLKEKLAQSNLKGMLQIPGTSFDLILDHLEDAQNKGLSLIIATTSIQRQVKQLNTTALFDWASHELNGALKIISCGVEKSSVGTEYVEFLPGDTVQGLGTIQSEKILSSALFYLDSVDPASLHPPVSAARVMIELTTLWPQLPSGCMVAIGKTASSFDGNTILIGEFMKEQNATKVFLGIQSAWIK